LQLLKTLQVRVNVVSYKTDIAFRPDCDEVERASTDRSNSVRSQA